MSSTPRLRLVLALLAAGRSPASANAPAGQPPLEAGDVAIQVLYGTGTSLLGGIVGAGVAFARCKQAGDNQTTGEECLDEVAIGAAIGGGLAFSLGVFLGGDTDTRTGSIGITLAGGLAGAAIGGGIALFARDRDGVVITAMIAGPVLGSLVGFNLTRRWRDYTLTPRVGSLLHVDRGRVVLGIPVVTPGATSISGSLISGRF